MLASALIFPVLLFAPATRDDAAEVVKKLEGTWLVETATADGTDVSRNPGSEIVFADGKITMKPGDGDAHTLAFRIDPSKSPAAFDLIPPDDAPPDAHPAQAIYELKGDTLKLCIAGGPNASRPTEFSDKGSLLMVLKRKKG